MRKGCVAVRNPVKLLRNSAKLLAKLPRNSAKPRETPRNSAKLLAKLPRNCAKLSRNCAWPLRPLSRRPARRTRRATICVTLELCSLGTCLRGQPARQKASERCVSVRLPFRLQSQILYMRMRSLNSRMKTPPLLTSPHASCLAGRTVAAAWLQPLRSGMHVRCFSGVISDDLVQP